MQRAFYTHQQQPQSAAANLTSHLLEGAGHIIRVRILRGARQGQEQLCGRVDVLAAAYEHHQIACDPMRVTNRSMSTPYANSTYLARGTGEMKYSTPYQSSPFAS